MTQAALAYAESLHEGQHRAVDGAPFIAHPIEVGMLLYESGAADEVIAAGVLHDTLEKTNATAYDIYARFGRRMGDIVCAVSHDPGIPGYARRKAALREQVANAGDEALTVFAADKLSKLRELRLGDRSELKVRSRKLRHYRLSLMMLQERLPGSPLVAVLAAELDSSQTPEERAPTPLSTPPLMNALAPRRRPVASSRHAGATGVAKTTVGVQDAARVATRRANGK